MKNFNQIYASRLFLFATAFIATRWKWVEPALEIFTEDITHIFLKETREESKVALVSEKKSVAKLRNNITICNKCLRLLKCK